MKISKSPCCYPGCGMLGQGRYCTKHDTKANHSGFTHALYAGKSRGSAWTKLREAILRRDDYLCQVCAEAGQITNAKEVDHIVPISQGGDDEPYNLQSICRPCHIAKTAKESRHT